MTSPQLVLFDSKGRARRTDPKTSHAAAARSEEFRESHEERILAAIRGAGTLGASYKEVARTTGMEPVAVARRLKAIEERGLIMRRKVDGTEVIDTREGCAVWVAT